MSATKLAIPMFITLTLVATAAPFVPLAAQGIEIVRPVNPTKPRDGFGMRLEMVATGRGEEIVQRGYPRVVAVDSGTPAAAAGLRVGDVLLTADGKDLTRETVHLRPPAGTRMVFRVRRGGEELEVTMVSVRLYTPPGPVRKDSPGVRDTTAQPRSPGAGPAVSRT